jgi:hypothetical protein
LLYLERYAFTYPITIPTIKFVYFFESYKKIIPIYIAIFADQPFYETKEYDDLNTTKKPPNGEDFYIT